MTSFRLACHICCTLAAISAASASLAAEIVSASFSQPTTRYPHAVLGDDIEYGGLTLSMSDGSEVEITVPTTRVFEDLVPRLVDVDGDNDKEIIVVESHQDHGARLSIYDETGLIDATPFIGQTFRWLAPIGAADLDGDGYIEIAYIDRPHLAKALKIWRFKDQKLQEIKFKSSGQTRKVLDGPGLSNHRIGWDYIAGGIKSCNDNHELVVATGDWKSVWTVNLTDKGSLRANEIRPGSSPHVFQAALNCP